MSVTISLVNHTRGRVETAWLLRQLRRVVRVMGIARGEWMVTVVGDAAMRELHQRTMGLDTTTDVMTFDLREREDTAFKSGGKKEGADVELDTVLCRDEAVRRARELGHLPREELLLYAVHSLLHVQGYDDVTAGEAARMHRREDELLIGLGMGPTYAGGAKEGGKKRGVLAQAARGRVKKRGA